MSLLFKLNLDTNEWEESINLESYFPILKLGFLTKDFYDNLKFGYEVFINNEKVVNKEFPENNIVYIKSDQDYLIYEQIPAKSDEKVLLNIWAENKKENYTKSIEFTVPRPEKPYESWVWNGLTWISPKPFPLDGKPYRWDEDVQEWELIEFE